MADHTPGPWRVEEFDEAQTCVIAGNQIIANCFQDDGLRHATARLIAAAPEMKERIAALEAAIESALVVLGIDLSDAKRWQAAEILRLALAGGEQGESDEE